MGSRIRRAAWALGAGVAVLALAPAGASASWTEPVLLSPGGFDANNPHVAMDKDGDAIAVWNRVDGTFFNRIHARPRTAAGTWGAVSGPLSDTGQHAENARVALDEDGDALIVWMRPDGTHTRIQARTRSKAGVLGPVLTLSAAGGAADEPRVAVDDDGDAIVSWIRNNGTNTVAQARTRTAAGVWAPTTALSAAGENASGSRVAIDDSGNGIVVWHRDDGSLDRVQYRARPAAGPWGPLTHVTAATLDAENPDVDMDQDGDALIAWEGKDASSIQRIETRFRSRTGALGPVTPVSSPTASAVSVAMTPAGQALLAWRRTTGANGHIESRTRSTTGTWSALKVLSNSPGDANEPRVAAGSGRAVAVWRRQDVDGNQRVETRHWLGSLWSPFTTLSDDNRDGVLAQVAIEELGGEAIAVWRTSDGSFFRIESSFGS
jgi:hypothetical protein